jgi:hypothetical protein
MMNASCKTFSTKLQTTARRRPIRSNNRSNSGPLSHQAVRNPRRSINPPSFKTVRQEALAAMRSRHRPCLSIQCGDQYGPAAEMWCQQQHRTIDRSRITVWARRLARLS